MWMYLGDLKGTIMKKDKELVHFTSIKDKVIEVTLLTHNKKDLPFEFKKGDTSSDAVRSFFEFRITPETRYRINDDLAKTPVEYYDTERLIRYQRGKSIDDAYWFLEDDSV